MELKITNKIRVVLNQKKLENYPEKRLEFYTNYAIIVVETLRKPLFQKFLNWIIKLEKIEKRAIKDIQVRVFPFKKDNGRSVAGRCNSSEGVILIFPKKRSFFQKKLQSHENGKVGDYLKCRARATLIHELLHIKYKGNESKVRNLTKKYFNKFIQHQNSDIQKMYTIQRGCV